MVKKIVAMKIEEFRKEELETIAKKRGMTVTDILLENLNNTEQVFRQGQQIQELQDQLRDITTKYQQATGRKPNTRKYITVPVTDQEFKKIKNAAFKENLPRGKFVRNMLLGQASLIPLESKP